MQRVYLVRHAMPDIPLGERWCIGHTDLPLGTVGKMQAALLPFVPELQGKPVFSRYLSRARETARPLCPDPLVRDGLEEQNMGVWDGLSFTEIQFLYPELYAAREKNPNLWPEDAESMDSVRERMASAVRRCMAETDGDLVIVSHKSAIDSITGSRPKLLHTSISVLEWEGSRYHVAEIGRLPHPALTEEVCQALLNAADVPQNVVAHCRAVASEVLRLADGLPSSAPPPDTELLFAAAMLHDIARTEPNHAALGAAWINALGYPEVADLVSRHHDYSGTGTDEAAILYLADKYLRGTERVSLEERFAESEKKCGTEEARIAHARRFEIAKMIENQVSGADHHV